MGEKLNEDAQTIDRYRPNIDPLYESLILG